MKSIVLSLVVVFSQVSFSQELPALTDIIQQRTLGTDSFYGRALWPSQSLETEKSKLERIQSSNSSLLAELGAVSKSFTSVAADQVVQSVYNVVTGIDPDVPGEGGHITFLGKNPSAAISRVLYLLPKSKLSSSNAASDLMDVLTSYKHSAKASDFLYQYQEPLNLTVGSIKEIEGTETSWMKPEAAAPYSEGQNYVIKKCRKVLGWRCITSLYRKDTITVGKDKTHVLFISLYDLEANQDHAEFANDKRSKNQISGTTAVYIIKETADWVMLYGSDYQYNNDKTSFTGAIQTEFQKDVARFKERISLDLGIAVKDIK